MDTRKLGMLTSRHPLARLFGGVQGIQDTLDVVFRCREHHTSRGFVHGNVSPMHTLSPYFSFQELQRMNAIANGNRAAPSSVNPHVMTLPIVSKLPRTQC